MAKTSTRGFSLAELLIALLIMGQIATFTIPKVLVSQQNARDKAVTKEAVSMVSGAVQAYSLKSGITANTWFYDFTPYMNYIKVETSTSVMDDDPGTIACSVSRPCYRLHNGAVLIHDQDRIGGNTSTNGLYFMIDPDGKSGSTNKSIYFLVYANGKIRTWATMENPTATQGNLYTPSGTDPAWFTWN